MTPKMDPWKCVELRDLNIGDEFRMFGVDECPEVRILDVRATEFTDMAQRSQSEIRLLLSGNVYTLERVDSPGYSFEITLDALSDVWQKCAPPTAQSRPWWRRLVGR